MCDERNTSHFCEEWDCFLHARCIVEFMQTTQGQMIIQHGHVVQIDFSKDLPLKETRDRVEMKKSEIGKETTNRLELTC